MVTRKTPSKTTAARTARTAPAKAENKAAAAAPTKRAAPPAKARTTPAPQAGAAVPAAAQQRKARTAPAEVPAGEARYRWIAHSAYLRAEKRGFAPGQEVEDWLAAEAEFLAVHGVG